MFFTVAVIVLITVLRDGHLTVFESGGMVVLYLAYVLVVIAGNWFSKRRRDKEARNLPASERSIHGDDGNAPMPPVIALPPASLDDSSEPNNELFSFPQTPSPTSLSPTASPRPHHHHSKSHALTSRLPHFQDDVPSYSLDTPRATFSLLGAIEFRDVVNSLRKESESHSSTPRSPSLIGESREDYFGPISAYGHRRALSQGGSLKKSSQTRGRQRAATYRPHLETQGRFASSPEVARVSSASPSREVLANGSAPPPDSNPWEDQLGNPASSLGPTDPSSPKPPRPRVQIPTKPTRDHSSLPTFSVTDPEGNAAAPPDTAAASRSSRTPSPSPPSHESRFRIRRHTRMALRVLFPSLQSFRHKSYIGMALAIMSVPAILALTLTLPVVDDGQTEGGVALPKGQDEPLIDDCAVCEAGQDDDGEDRLVNPEMGEELHHLVESGFTPLRSPLGRIHHSALRRMGDDLEEGDGSEGMTKELLEEIQQEEALEFHKALTAMQCVLGPMFCVVIIFRESTREESSI